jgi:hypothetical protein
MPITAKLSRQFYEKLGDEVANELVTWLNAVDQSYREEFRDLFESNFGRVEARLRELDARVEGKLDRLETRLVRWMFGFWIGAWVAMGGTLVALQRLH